MLSNLPSPLATVRLIKCVGGTIKLLDHGLKRAYADVTLEATVEKGDQKTERNECV